MAAELKSCKDKLHKAEAALAAARRYQPLSKLAAAAEEAAGQAGAPELVHNLLTAIRDGSTASQPLALRAFSDHFKNVQREPAGRRYCTAVKRLLALVPPSARAVLREVFCFVASDTELRGLVRKEGGGAFLGLSEQAVQEYAEFGKSEGLAKVVAGRQSTLFSLCFWPCVIMPNTCKQA
jgi:hypothetical protein